MSAEDYSSFLATKVLNDNRVMTYRLLSRELKIHVNRAKEMLASFHTSENKKNPGSCHATYIVTGIQKIIKTEESIKTDEENDVYMQSSPFPQPTPTQQDEPEVVMRSLTVILVSEEGLQEVKRSMDETSLSIHVYSVEPAPIKDLLVLSDATTELYSRFAGDEPIQKSKVYGMTLNKAAKRREGVRPPPPPQVSSKSSTYVVPVKKEPAAQAPTATPVPDVKKDFFVGSKKKEDGATKPALVKSESSSSSKSKPALKRGQSDLMASFSNTQPKKPKKPATPPPDFMDVDDDEQEEEVALDEEAKAAEAAKLEATRKKRKDDQEALRKMMEDDEDDEEPIHSAQASPTAIGSPNDPPSQDPAESSPVATAEAIDQPKRRRGKRKVVKQSHFKDEEGYLVSKQVTEWESYSEDELSAPASSKPPILSGKPNAFSAMKQQTGSQSGKSGKKGAGGGTGKTNITSFFAKK